MKLRRIICLFCFSLLVLVAYPQQQGEQKKVNSKSQTQKKTNPPKQVKKVPKSKAQAKKLNTRLKNSTQKQKMKKFVRKTNVKRKRGLKR